MMAFWDLDGGGTAKDSTGEFQQEGGNLEPIPAGSRLLMEVFEIKWAAEEQTHANRHIAIQWIAIAPEEFKGRRVFQKLWVTDFDPRISNTKGIEKATKKRNTAKTMLGAIDANAGRPLTKFDREPTEDDLQLLKGHPMVALLMVYSMPDSRDASAPPIQGNWVCGIFGAATGTQVAKAQPGKSVGEANKSAMAEIGKTDWGKKGAVIDDDEIPF